MLFLLNLGVGGGGVETFFFISINIVVVRIVVLINIVAVRIVVVLWLNSYWANKKSSRIVCFRFL